MTTGGKGDKPRPYSVPLEEFDNSWERIFGKKKKETQDQFKLEEMSKLIDNNGKTE